MKKFFPHKIEKETISIRVDTKLLNKIDIESAKIDISRNEFINQCIIYAIENMESKTE